MSAFAPTKIGGGAGAFVRKVGPVSFVEASAVCRSRLVPRSDPLSGLVRGLFGDFPGWNASFNFRPGEMPRMELPMLFLRGDRDSVGRSRVFARSNKVGEFRAVVEFAAGKVGECFTEGAPEGLRVGLCKDSRDNCAGCASVCTVARVSSTAVVLISGDEWVR